MLLCVPSSRCLARSAELNPGVPAEVGESPWDEGEVRSEDVGDDVLPHPSCGELMCCECTQATTMFV